MAKIVGAGGCEHSVESLTVQIREEEEVGLSKPRLKPGKICLPTAQRGGTFIHKLRRGNRAELGSTVSELCDVGQGSHSLGHSLLT